MANNHTALLADVADYYASKLAQHGDTPRGVDWNGEDSQILRFRQLSKIITVESPFSITDLGCGYGAFYDFLKTRYADVSYIGLDVSEDMIGAARKRLGDQDHARFTVSGTPDIVTDYAVASGIFNVRLHHAESDWSDYLEATLDTLDRCSRVGFAFNCLTSYSDAEKMRDYLHYADPCRLFDLCKRRYARNVALLHDYGLYEFTILVRKTV